MPRRADAVNVAKALFSAWPSPCHLDAHMVRVARGLTPAKSRYAKKHKSHFYQLRSDLRERQDSSAWTGRGRGKVRSRVEECLNPKGIVVESQGLAGWHSPCID